MLSVYPPYALEFQKREKEVKPSPLKHRKQFYKQNDKPM